MGKVYISATKLKSMVSWGTMDIVFASMLIISGPIITVAGASYEPWILIPLGVIVQVSGWYFFIRGITSQKQEERAATAAAKASADSSPLE